MLGVQLLSLGGSAVYQPGMLAALTGAAAVLTMAPLGALHGAADAVEPAVARVVGQAWEAGLGATSAADGVAVDEQALAFRNALQQQLQSGSLVADVLQTTGVVGQALRLTISAVMPRLDIVLDQLVATSVAATSGAAAAAAAAAASGGGSAGAGIAGAAGAGAVVGRAATARDSTVLVKAATSAVVLSWVDGVKMLSLKWALLVFAGLTCAALVVDQSVGRAVAAAEKTRAAVAAAKARTRQAAVDAAATVSDAAGGAAATIGSVAGNAAGTAMESGRVGWTGWELGGAGW